jgi:hypothetical protein
MTYKKYVIPNERSEEESLRGIDREGVLMGGGWIKFRSSAGASERAGKLGYIIPIEHSEEESLRGIESKGVLLG